MQFYLSTKKKSPFAKIFNNHNILTSPTTDVIKKNSIIQPRRFEDHFMTVDELIIKYFTDKEITCIRSDPKYFKIKGLNDDNQILKTRLLADIITAENQNENVAKLLKLKTNITKNQRLTSFRYVFLYFHHIFYISFYFSNLYNKLKILTFFHFLYIRASVMLPEKKNYLPTLKEDLTNIQNDRLLKVDFNGDKVVNPNYCNFNSTERKAILISLQMQS